MVSLVGRLPYIFCRRYTVRETSFPFSRIFHTRPVYTAFVKFWSGKNVNFLSFWNSKNIIDFVVREEIRFVAMCESRTANNFIYSLSKEGINSLVFKKVLTV